MDLRVRCRCGRFQGRLADVERAGRAICYCGDCQAFARFLGEPGRILDAQAGSEIIATSPRLLHIAQGSEQLRCMSLGPKGLLRWYTACCRTPVGNTPRDPKVSYVGLLHNCLEATSAERDAALGPAEVAFNTASARGKVRSTPWATLRALLKIAGQVGGSRLSGKYRDNPFFEPGTSEPVRAPRVLTLRERRALGGG